MVHVEFAQRVTELLRHDEAVAGLAVGGSWLTGELDQYADLDLILVTHEDITGDRACMIAYASRFGRLLTAFTGEHVGEPRLLICLFADPLLHVDIKFLTPDGFRERVEQPVLLLDRMGGLHKILDETPVVFPHPDYQWIEDRFWVWIHYALLKIGRGEWLEAFDFLGFLRMVVLGPLLLMHNHQLPRGVRKAETRLSPADLERLLATVPSYSREDISRALADSVALYRYLRKQLFTSGVVQQADAEREVMIYFEQTINQAS